MRLAGKAAQELVEGRNVHTHDLVVSLRAFIREALDLAPVSADFAIPRQGPTRLPGTSSGKGKGGDEAGRGGSGDRQGGGNGGLAMGMGMAGAGAGLGHEIEDHDDHEQHPK